MYVHAYIQGILSEISSNLIDDRSSIKRQDKKNSDNLRISVVVYTHILRRVKRTIEHWSDTCYRNG